MRENPMGGPKNGAIRLQFDRRLRLEFRGAKITTDAGLLAVRELDEMMGLTDMAGELIEDKRTGKNIQHQIPGLLRQSVYACLAGYEDTNDHEGLSRCLLYTSDAADDLLCVDLGGRRIIKKKNNI